MKITVTPNQEGHFKINLDDALRPSKHQGLNRVRGHRSSKNKDPNIRYGIPEEARGPDQTYGHTRELKVHKKGVRFQPIRVDISNYRLAEETEQAYIEKFGEACERSTRYYDPEWLRLQEEILYDAIEGNRDHLLDFDRRRDDHNLLSGRIQVAIDL